MFVLGLFVALIASSPRLSQTGVVFDTSISMSNKTIQDVAPPLKPRDAATRQFVEASIGSSGSCCGMAPAESSLECPKIVHAGSPVRIRAFIHICQFVCNILGRNTYSGPAGTVEEASLIRVNAATGESASSVVLASLGTFEATLMLTTAGVVLINSTFHKRLLGEGSVFVTVLPGSIDNGVVVCDTTSIVNCHLNLFDQWGNPSGMATDTGRMSCTGTVDGQSMACGDYAFLDIGVFEIMTLCSYVEGVMVVDAFVDGQPFGSDGGVIVKGVTPLGSQCHEPAPTCSAVQASYLSMTGTPALSGAYYLRTNMSAPPSTTVRVLCDQDTAGGGWTLCLKYDRDGSGSRWLVDGVGRSEMNVDDMEDVATFSGRFASIDCRDLVNPELGNATFWLHAGSDSESVAWPLARITTFPDGVRSDSQDLFDTSLDDTGTCDLGVVRTFGTDWVEYVGSDQGKDLADGSCVLAGHGFCSLSRAGMRFSNAGSGGACSGTVSDSVYWAWIDDDHGSGSGPPMIGTGSNNAGNEPTHRYNLLLMR